MQREKDQAAQYSVDDKERELACKDILYTEKSAEIVN